MRRAFKIALINSALMGGAVFVGMFADGEITQKGIIIALAAALGVFFTNLKQFFTNIRNKKGMVRPGIGIFYGI